MEGRVRQGENEMAQYRSRSEDAEREAEATRALLARTKADLEDMAAHAASSAQVQAAEWQGERNALSEELTQLRADLAASHAQHAVQLSDLRQQQDDELRQVEERVRLLGLRKDETITALQQQLTTAQQQLLINQRHLQSVQQEVL
ncbi:MAG: hypothetical protein SGPRY_011964, partial [Prymnesium sp.]